MRWSRPAPAPPPFALETPLLDLAEGDPWRIRDACEGTQILGATGSGKTSGSGQAIARAFLHAGFGGLVLTAKPDERALWEHYCITSGRGDSLVVIEPDGPFTFNFLDYELRRPGAGAGLTHNLVELFFSVIEAVDGGRRGSQDTFWDRALRQLLRNTIDVLIPSRATLKLDEMVSFILSAPQSPEQVFSPDWQQRSFCYQSLAEGDAKVSGTPREADFTAAGRYWCGEFPALAEKTRSIVVTSFTAIAEALLRGSLRHLFCGATTVVPEMAHEGCILLIDLPVKEYNEVGRFAQILLKRQFQAATERRDTTANPRPVFLWADEAQFFIAKDDLAFQTTARSSRACTVYLTQNLPSYYSLFPGEGGRAFIDALLGNLTTKILHANGDITTNQWAADLFARSWQKRLNTGASSNEQKQSGMNVGFSDSLEHLVQPAEFGGLRRGGLESALQVDAIIHQGGRQWRQSGTSALRTTFFQLQS